MTGLLLGPSHAGPPAPAEHFEDVLARSVGNLASEGSLLAHWFEQCPGTDGAGEPVNEFATRRCIERRDAFRQQAAGQLNCALVDRSHVRLDQYDFRIHGFPVSWDGFAGDPRFAGDLTHVPFGDAWLVQLPPRQWFVSMPDLSRAERLRVHGRLALQVVFRAGPLEAGESQIGTMVRPVRGATLAAARLLDLATGEVLHSVPPSRERLVDVTGFDRAPPGAEERLLCRRATRDDLAFRRAGPAGLSTPADRSRPGRAP